MTSQTKIALFVDADNASPGSIPAIMEELTGKYGEVTYRRVYRNWQMRSDKWNAVIADYSMQPIHQASNAKGKNSSDIKLIIDAMDALYAGAIDCFCIVSSDSDYTSLAVRLRESGKDVIGVGAHDKVKDNSALARACSKFIFVENLETDAPADASASSGQRARAAAAELSAADKADVEHMITDIILANAEDDGTMNLSQLKQAIVNLRPDFDVRTYGFASFSKFLAAFGGFELVPPDAPSGIKLTGGRHRTAQVFELVQDYVREAGSAGRTLPEVGSAINKRFPGQTIRALGYNRIEKLLGDVPGVYVAVNDEGVKVAVAE